jgi:TonB family protein
MSSAEDRNFSHTPPLTSSSEPQVEDCPIEAGELEAPRLEPKPNLKANMVAHQVQLKVAGTHRANGAGGAELFGEETSSALVYANGGVIQLSAAVVPGQLLLLTNVESKRDVVAQVRRRRACNSTTCYVELEFAEPAPRFWGMEFSAASALLPKNAKDAETAALILSAEVIADNPGEPAAAATVAEAEALRREMEALREQVAGTAESGKSPSDEHDLVAKELTAAEQAIPHLPKRSWKFSMSLPKTGRLRARGNFTPGFRGGVLRLALLTTALAVTVLGAAWYKHWIPWKSAAKKPSISVSAVGSDAGTSPPKGSQELATGHSEFTHTNGASDTPAISRSLPSQVPGSASQPGASRGSVIRPTARETSHLATLAAKGTMARPPARATAEVKGSPAQSVITPPKLIKSVRAVASLDDLRDFETGNVVIDAVVGTEGEVHFVRVISGPPSLRAAAIEAVKQYRYEPAMRDGQPVPEHVNITVHFRFES